MIQAIENIGTQWLTHLCNGIIKEGYIPQRTGNRVSYYQFKRVLSLGLECQILGLEAQVLGLGLAASPCNCQSLNAIFFVGNLCLFTLHSFIDYLLKHTSSNSVAYAERQYSTLLLI